MNIGLSADRDTTICKKLQVIYSPNDDEFAIFTPNKILIYKLYTNATDYSNTECTDPLNSIPIPSASLRITLSYNNNILQYNDYDPCSAMCLAWKPDTEFKRIFAIGLNTGQVILREITNRHFPNTHPDINNTYFHSIHTVAPCASLIWNPQANHVLAIGYPSRKSDQSLGIWDTNSSFERKNMYPAITTGSILSLDWLPDSDQTLVYCNKGGVDIFRYATHTLRGIPNRSKCINGLCVDSLSKHYVAAHDNNKKIRVWDIKNIPNPIIRYETDDPIEDMCWSRYKPACLIILTTLMVYVLDLPYPPTDTPYPLEVSNKERAEETRGSHDIQAPPLLVRHMSFKSLNPYCRTSTSRYSILPLPPRRDSMLLLHWSDDKETTTSPLQADITIGRVDLPMHLAISLSPRGDVAMATDLTIEICQLSEEFQLPVVSMCSYLKQGYGFDVCRNREISRDNLALNNLWKWFERISQFVGDRRERHLNILLDGLSSEIYRETDIDSKGAIDFKKKQSLNLSSEIVPRWKESPNRKLCLQILRRIPMEDSPEEFNKLLNSLTERGAVGEAVLACFCNDSTPVGPTSIQHAIDVLQKSDYTDKAVALMALAGYPEMCSSQIWLDTCLSQTAELNDPHLRIAIKVLYSDYSGLRKSIKQERLSHNAKFALACTYLKDSDLGEFVSEEIEAIKDASDIEGLFIFGLNKSGFSIMNNYINRTSDLLTVSIISTLSINYYTRTSRIIPNELNQLSNSWWCALSDLLDQLCLWKERCQLNISRNKILKSTNRPLNESYKKIQDKWELLCPFCSKPITDSTNQEFKQTKRSKGPYRIGGGSSTKVTSTGTCCPNCSKPLPRCVICQRHMGSPAYQPSSEAKSPVDDWVTWCQSCGHWGHTLHLSDWFRENTRCAAPNCNCTCYAMDELVKSVN